jgi:two-component system invasion response regulator UvrY
MIRVFVADDHAIVRGGIRRILEDQPDIQIVGEAAEGQEAIQKILEADPDVILLDISMPGMDGLDVTKQLKAIDSKVRILILTMHAEEQYAPRLMKAGAMGYVTKHAAPEDLVKAIHAVHSGKRFISPSLAENMAWMYLGNRKALSPIECLSDRELQVLRLLAKGNTNREIAGSLHLSIKTIDTYRARVLEKLNLRNNSELTLFAVQHGLIEK